MAPFPLVQVDQFVKKNKNSPRLSCEPFLNFQNPDEQVGSSSSLKPKDPRKYLKTRKNLFWDQDNLRAETLFLLQHMLAKDQAAGFENEQCFSTKEGSLQRYFLQRVNVGEVSLIFYSLPDRMCPWPHYKKKKKEEETDPQQKQVPISPEI